MKNHIKDSNKKLAIIGGKNSSDSVKEEREMSISTEVYIWLQMVDCVHVFVSCPPSETLQEEIYIINENAEGEAAFH